ncbi:MAG: YdcF family protein [Proteobacteria bacterium]|nr:YdcF family protein [Pseudomonadota bacterium]
MNSLFVLLGIESWKPVLAALLMPPVPLLLLVLVGARLMLPRRGWGWLAIATGVVLLWLMSCTGSADLLTRTLLHPPPALGTDRIAALKADAAAHRPIAILALGGGVERYAPEYGTADLSAYSLERLRYAVWLARRTGLPAGYSGGLGWAQQDATPEARVAAQIAAQEYGLPLRWVEEDSRDTRENAGYSVALLKRDGIHRIVLVTHGWHMPRARRAFEEAAAAEHADITIEPAPIAVAPHTERPVLRWIPSTYGFVDVRNVVHELLGRWFGA